MIWVDYAILTIIGISALISILRGFIREALSLLGWIVAIWVSMSFAEDVAALLVDKISVPSVRIASAFLILFFACLIGAGVINFLAGKLVEKLDCPAPIESGCRVRHRAGGAGSRDPGVARRFYRGTPRPVVDQSVLLKHFESMAVQLRGFLPPDIAANINY